MRAIDAHQPSTPQTSTLYQLTLGFLFPKRKLTRDSFPLSLLYNLPYSLSYLLHPCAASPLLKAAITKSTHSGLAFRPITPTRQTLPAVGPSPPAISR